MNPNSRRLRWVSLIAGFAILVTLISLGAISVLSVSAASTPVQLPLFDADGSGTTDTIDLYKQGDFPGVGDIILENHDLYDVKTGLLIGSATTRGQGVRALPGGDLLFLIDCTVNLPNGTFHFTGGTTFAAIGGEGAVLPIVGGTGAYELAQGTMHLKTGKLGSRDGTYLTAEIVQR